MIGRLSLVASENSFHLTRGQHESEHDRRMIAIAFLFVGVLCDCFKSRRRLEVEIWYCGISSMSCSSGHQPIAIRWADRALFVWLYRRWPRILDAVTIVRPRLLCVGIAWACRVLAMEIPSAVAGHGSAKRWRSDRRMSLRTAVGRSQDPRELLKLASMSRSPRFRSIWCRGRVGHCRPGRVPSQSWGGDCID